MKIQNGRIAVYLADIRPLFQESLQKRAYALVGEERRRKADACRTPEAKAASLAAGFLAAFALRENGYGHCTVTYAGEGRPLVKTSPGEPSVYISLSHSGDYAVCALALRPVGVDIQKMQPVRTGMLRHFFTREQRTAFQERFGGEKEPFLPEAAQKAFLRCWAAKESYMKLTGIGMAMGFDRITADLDQELVSGNGKENPAVLKEYPAPEGYILAACILRENVI